MILMGMRNDNALELVLALLDEPQIGKDKIGAGQAVVGKGQTQIDHHPAIVEAVEIDIHANLTDAPERYKQEVAAHAELPLAGIRS